jgi:glycine/D-amino acid oxidase-like deaminating enzyme
VFVTEVLGIQPEKWQAEALMNVAKHDRVTIRSGHGIGKTAFESCLV